MRGGEQLSKRSFRTATRPAVERAIALAAAHRNDGRPVSTSDLVRAVLADPETDTTRLQLVIGDGTALPWGIADPDPGVRPNQTWLGAKLSGTLVDALDRATWAIECYDEEADVDAPYLVAAIVAEPAAIATILLVRASGLTQPRLLRRVIETMEEDEHEALELALACSLSSLPGDADRWRSVAQMIEGDRAPTATSTFAALLLTSDHEPLCEELPMMALDRDHLTELLFERKRGRGWPAEDRSASSAIEAAQARWRRSDPSDLDVLFILAKDACPSLEHLLWRVGLTPGEIGAAVTEMGQQRYRRRAGPLVLPLSAAGVVLTVLTLVAIGLAASDRSWWLLLLLPIANLGHPSQSVAAGLTQAALLLPLTGPAPAVLHLVATLVGGAQGRAERNLLLAESGVRLSARQHRRMLQRRHARARAGIGMRYFHALKAQNTMEQRAPEEAA